MPTVELFSLSIISSLRDGDLEECLRTGEIRLTLESLVLVSESDLTRFVVEMVCGLRLN